MRDFLHIEKYAIVLITISLFFYFSISSDGHRR